MRLMITGAGGFLGSRLVSFYQDRYEVWGALRGEVDFTDAPQAMEAVSLYKPDVVIHCGAISDVAACSADPALSWKVNVEGAQNLAMACARANAHFVFCSSDQVYFRRWQQEKGISREDFLRPHREEEALNPDPVYGRHKLAAEEACRLAQPDSVILRLTWLYDELTREELAKGRRNLATMLIEADRRGQKEPPPAFSETDYRGVTDAREVARNMEAAWQMPAGIYNFGSTGGFPVYESVRRVMKTFGKEGLVKKAAPGALRNLAMDTAKAEKLGIRFSGTQEGLERWLTEHGSR